MGGLLHQGRGSSTVGEMVWQWSCRIQPAQRDFELGRAAGVRQEKGQFPEGRLSPDSRPGPRFFRTRGSLRMNLEGYPTTRS